MTRPPHDRGTEPPEESMELLFERLVEGDPISRRSALRRFAAAGLSVGVTSSFLAACGGVEGTKKSATTVEAGERQSPEGGDRQARSSRTGRSTSTRRCSRRARRSTARKRASYVEDYQRQRGVLRQGPPAARGRSAASAATRRADRLDGRPLGRPRLRRADRQEERAERRQNLQRQPQRIRRTTRTATSRCRGSPGVTGIGYNPKKTGRKLHEHQRPLRSRRSRAGSRCFSEWRDSAGLMLLGDGHGSDDGDDRTTTRRRSTRSTRTSKKGQIRRFTGNDYIDRPAAKGNLWACVAWSGDLVQLQADNPNLRVPRARGGRDDLVADNMMIPQKAEHGLRRRDVDELRLRARRSPPRSRPTSTTSRPVKGVEGGPREDRSRSSPTTR